MGRYYYDDYPPYVPVAERRARAAREVAKRIKEGQAVSPVRIEGRTIASTFWGQAWCVNLEGYSDYENRLPRGRTYARNGSVVHLKIGKGRIEALVSGSQLYEIQIDISALPQPDWRALKGRCAGQIGTLVELLRGKLSKAVMEMVTDRKAGLFPNPKEIKMRCSCPDSAGMCKHLAATMYGVGNRLDSSPELLFLLRGVDHLELIEQAIPATPARAKGGAPTLAASDLGAIFDIDLDEAPIASARSKISAKPAAKPARVMKKPRATSKASDIQAPVRSAAKKTATTARPAAKPVDKKPAPPKKSKAKTGLKNE